MDRVYFVNIVVMESSVAVIPKVENIFVHTGNIVNWSRLKETVSKSKTSEVIGLSSCRSNVFNVTPPTPTLLVMWFR